MVTKLRNFRTSAIGVIVASTALIGTEVISKDKVDDGFVSLFDGYSLAGWEGKRTVFRVENGAIVGGTLESPILQREYLCTTQEYDDFELRIEAKIEGDQNSGIHFRSYRLPNSNEVAGYQADIGFAPGRIIMMLSDVTGIDRLEPYPLWGTLFDEFRVGLGSERYHSKKNPFRLLDVADRKIVDKVYLEDDWNQLTITAVDRRIEIRLNDVLTSTYEEQLDIVQDGFICLQSHDGPPSKASFKNIEIREIKDH